MWEAYVFPTYWDSTSFYVGESMLTTRNVHISTSLEGQEPVSFPFTEWSFYVPHRWSINDMNQWWQYIPNHWENLSHEKKFALTLVIHLHTWLACAFHLVTSTLSLDQAKAFKSFRYGLCHLGLSSNCFYEVEFWFYATSWHWRAWKIQNTINL